MEAMYVCKLCLEIPTSFPDKDRVLCDNVACVLHEIVMKTEEWNRLMRFHETPIVTTYEPGSTAEHVKTIAGLRERLGHQGGELLLYCRNITELRESLDQQRAETDRQINQREQMRREMVAIHAAQAKTIGSICDMLRLLKDDVERTLAVP